MSKQTDLINIPDAITVSGSNVGIGTSSPSRQLEIYDDGTVGQAVLALTAQNTDPSRIMFADPDDVNIGILDYHHSDNSMRFIVNNAESMRIDTSGNLLVGKTAINATDTGIVASANGRLYATVNGDTSLFNRLTSDGDIVEFRKDNTTVGSIGANSNRLQIQSGSGGDLILGTGNNADAYRLSDAVFYPSVGDATADLGLSNRRFKDLYLSGGVYLGGTGSANLLDDYEEGTWTPSFTYSGGNPATVSYGNQTGHYTKIGNICHYTCDVRLTAFSRGSASGTLQLQGLPFPTKNHANYARPNSVPNLYQWPYQTNSGYHPMFGMFQDGVAKGDFSMMRPNAASTQVNDPDGDSMLFLTGWYYTS